MLSEFQMEDDPMIEIEDLSEKEITAMLSRLGYGHLACCRGDVPYVVPVNFAFEEGRIYLYTTEGKKADFIASNPNVCLQAEDVVDNRHWQSVIVDGVASEIEDGPERERALRLIIKVNPTLTPAVSIRWMDEWVRENIEVIYRIRPTATSGRRALDRTGGKPFVPNAGGRFNIN